MAHRRRPFRESDPFLSSIGVGVPGCYTQRGRCRHLRTVASAVTTKTLPGLNWEDPPSQFLSHSAPFTTVQVRPGVRCGPRTSHP